MIVNKKVVRVNYELLIGCGYSTGTGTQIRVPAPYSCMGISHACAIVSVAAACTRTALLINDDIIGPRAVVLCRHVTHVTRTYLRSARLWFAGTFHADLLCSCTLTVLIRITFGLPLHRKLPCRLASRSRLPLSPLTPAGPAVTIEIINKGCLGEVPYSI